MVKVRTNSFSPQGVPSPHVTSFQAAIYHGKIQLGGTMTELEPCSCVSASRALKYINLLSFFISMWPLVFFS